MPENRPDPRTSLIQSLSLLFEKNSVRRMVLSKPQDKTVVRGELRPTSIKGETVLQISRQMKDGKALHQNIPVSECNAVSKCCLLISGSGISSPKQGKHRCLSIPKAA